MKRRFEAFKYVAEDVKRQISNNPDLEPQHSLIDDNGDKIGHPWDELENDGDLATDTFL